MFLHEQSGIDRQTVKNTIKDSIFPLLKDIGYEDFESGTRARKFDGTKYDVVEFYFFPTAKTEAWGIPATSFTFEAGCFFPYIPAQSVKELNGKYFPDILDCHIRRRSRRGKKSWSLSKCPPNMWCIKNQRQLDEAMHDVQIIFREEFAPWFSQLSDPKNVLDYFQTKDEDELVWNFGRLNSPSRIFRLGYVEMKLGNNELASELLNKYLMISSDEWLINEAKKTLGKL